MAVRVRIRIARAARRDPRFIETVAVANSGFEAEEPELLLPIRAAERLGLWPPPAGAHAAHFESPAASFSMTSVRHGVRVSLAGGRRLVVANAILAERETEVVMNDHLVEALKLVLVAPASGRYRVGSRGRIRESDPAETW